MEGNREKENDVYDPLNIVDDWASDHFVEIALVVMFLWLCGLAGSMWYLWVAFLRSPFIKLWNKYVRNPISWLLQPFRRMYSRRVRRIQGEKMAKWRKGHLANAFYETIHREIDAGRISKQQGKQLQCQMAKFFGLDDLARIKTHKDAIRHRLELNKEYLIGPKGTLPGPKPGEDVVLDYKYEGLGSKFLNRKKAS